MGRSDGRLIYLAVEPEFIKQELEKLFSDISILLKRKLTVSEIFYYAAYIHLVFVNIHPFVDGNGRATRLIEKWFLAEKLGPKAWWVQSERNYYAQHQTYYNNIRQLGLEYEVLDYSKALPFLRMLFASL